MMAYLVYKCGELLAGFMSLCMAILFIEGQYQESDTAIDIVDGATGEVVDTWFNGKWGEEEFSDFSKELFDKSQQQTITEKEDLKVTFKVRWTGSYPCLCHGEWIILKNDVDVSAAIPEDLRNNEMGTAGTYSHWYFESDWSEVWEDYEDGIEEAEWIAANPWIASICDTDTEKSELFRAIQSQDWRHSSCGGCI